MDQLISPDTRDYTGTRCYSLQNAIWLRLETPLGSYWADPTVGSRLHELARSKDVSRVEMQARQYSEQALQPLLDDSRAQSITISTSRPQKGWLYLHIDVVDSTGVTHKFKHPVRIA